MILIRCYYLVSFQQYIFWDLFQGLCNEGERKKMVDLKPKDKKWKWKKNCVQRHNFWKHDFAQFQIKIIIGGGGGRG